MPELAVFSRIMAPVLAEPLRLTHADRDDVRDIASAVR
jgi:hypothetical protein